MPITISNRIPVVVVPSSPSDTPGAASNVGATTRTVTNVNAVPSTGFSTDRLAGQADQIIRRAISPLGAGPARVDTSGVAAVRPLAATPAPSAAELGPQVVTQLERRTQLQWEALIRREIDSRRASYHDVLLEHVAKMEDIAGKSIAEQYPNAQYLGVNWKTTQLEYYDPRLLLEKRITVNFANPKILEIIRILNETNPSSNEVPVEYWSKQLLEALCNAPLSPGQTRFLPAFLQLQNLQQAHDQFLQDNAISAGERWALAPGVSIPAPESTDRQVAMIRLDNPSQARSFFAEHKTRQAYAQFQAYVDQQLSQITRSLALVAGKLQPIAGASDTDIVASYEAVVALNILKLTFANDRSRGAFQMKQALRQAIINSRVDGVAGIRDGLCGGGEDPAQGQALVAPAPGAPVPSASGASQQGLTGGDVMLMTLDANAPVAQTLLEICQRTDKLGAALGQALMLVSVVRFCLSLTAYHNAPPAERAKALTAVVFDGVAVGLGVTSMAGGATSSAAASWLAVPVAGIGIGVTALVSHFSQIGAEADKLGDEVETLYEGIRRGGVFIKEGVMRERPEVVIDTLDLKRGTLKYGAAWIYATTESRSNEVGGPDPHKKIDMIERMGLSKENRLAMGAKSLTMLELPYNLEVVRDYKYVVLPTSWSRKSRGFPRLDAMGPDFQFRTMLLSEYIISDVRRKPMPNTKNIILEDLELTVLMPHFPPINEFDEPRLIYNLKGDAGPYVLVMKPGSRVNLQSERPELTGWRLDTRGLDSDQVEWTEDGGLWVGGLNGRRDNAVKIAIAPECAAIGLTLIDQNGNESRLIRPEQQDEDE